MKERIFLFESCDCALLSAISQRAPAMTETKKSSDRKYFMIFLRFLGYVEISVWFQTLLELVDYVNSAKQPFAEHIMPEAVNMVESAHDV